MSAFFFSSASCVSAHSVEPSSPGSSPSHYASEWVADGRLRAIRPAQLAYVSDFHCVTRQGAEPGEALGAFLDVLARAQAELGSGVCAP